VFTVFVTLQVREEQIEAFVDGIHRNAIASLRDEDDCLRFDVHRSDEDPTRFYFYEIYRDREAFEVEHRAAPHYSEWREIVDRCVVPGSQVITIAHPAFPAEFRP
jgi:autoinducer 2-degrading protein